MIEYPFWSTVYLTLTTIYFLVASIVTFDIRLIQARQRGENYGMLPEWTGIFGFAQWILFAALFVLNWKAALMIFVVKFILKVLPVLETIGNILMRPFRPKPDKELEQISEELFESIGFDFHKEIAEIEDQRAKAESSDQYNDIRDLLKK